MKRKITFIIGLLFCAFGFTQDVASIDNTIEIVEENDKIVSFLYKPSNIFENPDLYLYADILEAIPLEYYTGRELAIQKELNEKEEGIITFSKGDNQFFPRSIDREDITPYTWKWIHLQVEEDDGSYTNVHLRRPNWWLSENNVTSIGSNIHLTIPQIGLDKEVYVKAIYPNQLDTRLWDNEKNGNLVTRPITGRVEHYVNNVVNISFEENDQKSMSVTSNHLLWSSDRDKWVQVGNLYIGEKLTTKQGVVTLKERIAKEGWYLVYDIEVYRDHNFLVSLHNVLAHNSCLLQAGGKKGGWNKTLNGKLGKNTSYNVDGYLYKTDNLGRVSGVKGDLTLKNRGRNGHQQGKSVTMKDGVKGADDGGHLIAQIFNGPGEQINYVPMLRGVNRGTWKKMENQWATALKDGNKVSVDIKPVYQGGSKRPVGMSVSYTIKNSSGKILESVNKTVLNN